MAARRKSECVALVGHGRDESGPLELGQVVAALEASGADRRAAQEADSVRRRVSMNRETYDRIKRQHGGYASWAVWAEPTGSPKSGVGDLNVLDPEANPDLLRTVRTDVVMLGLNLARAFPEDPLANFHDRASRGQDYKIRHAFAHTPYYGAYMTDLIKGEVMLKSSDLMRAVGSDPAKIRISVEMFPGELTDLQSSSPPLLIAFGGDAYALAAKHLPSGSYSRLIKVTHYSNYISQENYRSRVLAELA